jgi:hypothetical protein
MFFWFDTHALNPSPAPLAGFVTVRREIMA